MSDPILKIGRVVEVSGSKVIGELEGTVEDLHRTYKSRRYTVGQVGSIVKIEAGDKLVFGVVTALRMTETMLVGAAVIDRATTSDGTSNAKWLSDVSTHGTV